MAYELGRGRNLHVEHPLLTYGQMVEISRKTPIERSDHIGNLHPAALITVTDPEVNGSQLLVDSNNGDDREYFPRHLVYKGNRIPMTPASRGTTVTRKLSAEYDKKNGRLINEALGELGLEHIDIGSSLADLHLTALNTVSRNTEILTNADIMATYPDAAEAMVKYLASIGVLKRVVTVEGKIIEHANPGHTEIKNYGIYGIADRSPLDTGVMLPLPGILALDIIDNAARGSETIFHQAGCDMRRYTYDERLMSLVALTVGAGLDALHINEAPRYAVIDTGNIGNIAATTGMGAVRSQYDALALQRDGIVYQVPVDSYDMPLWSED